MGLADMDLPFTSLTIASIAYPIRARSQFVILTCSKPPADRNPRVATVSAARPAVPIAECLGHASYGSGQRFLGGSTACHLLAESMADHRQAASFGSNNTAKNEISIPVVSLSH
jgi:hypothetical protein